MSQRVAVLMQWAQDKGLQLAEQDWQYLAQKHRIYYFTQALLNSFSMPRLHC